MKTLLLLQLFISLVLATDLYHQDEQQRNDPHPDYPDYQKLVSESQMDFAVRIYQQISSPVQRPPPQIFISPLSIYITLSMVALGSHGRTRDEILSAFALNSTQKDTVLHEGNRRILQAIHRQTKDWVFKLGNEVFIKKGGSFLPQFKDMMDLYYNAPIHTISFSDPRAAEETINKIVRDKTDNKIREIVDNLDSDTSILLLDYAVFQDMWKFSFPRQNTRQVKFTLNDRTSVTVPMMNKQGLYRMYKDREMECDMVELPYNDNLSLVIIVPKLRDLYRVQEKLTAQRIKRYIRSMKTSLVNFYIPKLSFNYDVDLKHYMMVMGMESMFTKNANFIRFSRDQKLKVLEMYHQSYINIDEKGTEETSSTDAQLNNLSAALDYKVDHPYIMLIYHRDTETVLGIGQVTNPVGKSPRQQGEGEI